MTAASLESGGFRSMMPGKLQHLFSFPFPPFPSPTDIVWVKDDAQVPQKWTLTVASCKTSLVPESLFFPPPLFSFFRHRRERQTVSYKRETKTSYNSFILPPCGHPFFFFPLFFFPDWVKIKSRKLSDQAFLPSLSSLSPLQVLFPLLF